MVAGPARSGVWAFRSPLLSLNTHAPLQKEEERETYRTPQSPDNTRRKRPNKKMHAIREEIKENDESMSIFRSIRHGSHTHTPYDRLETGRDTANDMKRFQKLKRRKGHINMEKSNTDKNKEKKVENEIRNTRENKRERKKNQ